MSSKLASILAIAGTYQGRDKVVRLITYILYVLRGKLQKSRNCERKISILIQQLSDLRVMLRLFDDVYMLQFSISYGFGSKEKDAWCRYLQLIKNLADQLYYPVEHIAWARDVKILKGNSGSLWSFGCGLWVVSLAMGILKTIRVLWILGTEEQILKKNLNKLKSTGCQCCLDRNICNCEVSRCQIESKEHALQQVKDIHLKKKYLWIDLIENLADIINGINWLPDGFLWASKMSFTTTGILGTISSFCQLYKHFDPKQ